MISSTKLSTTFEYFREQHKMCVFFKKCVLEGSVKPLEDYLVFHVPSKGGCAGCCGRLFTHDAHEYCAVVPTTDEEIDKLEEKLKAHLLMVFLE